MKIVSSSLLLVLFALFACKTAETSSTVVINQEAETWKGTLIELPKRTDEGLLDEKEIYFQVPAQVMKVIICNI